MTKADKSGRNREPLIKFMAIHRKLRNLLLDTGLTEAETLVYLDLLKKPAEAVFDLIKRTGLSKSAVYRAFARLEFLQMVEKTKEGIRALSLKVLVAELLTRERKLRKTAYKLKQLAPFLRAPREAIEEFEAFYTPEQISEAYLFMSEIAYDVNFDFGDFENFLPLVGGIKSGVKFRNQRAKHAINHAICTVPGPNTDFFCTREAIQKYHNYVKYLPLDYQNNFVIFSDTNDYVLFNNFEDQDYPVSTLVKSRAVADAQRMQFKAFSAGV